MKYDITVRTYASYEKTFVADSKAELEEQVEVFVRSISGDDPPQPDYGGIDEVVLNCIDDEFVGETLSVG